MAKLDKTKASKLEHRTQKAPIRTRFSAFNTRYLAIFNLKYKSQVDKRTEYILPQSNLHYSN